ncbi:hypothetical protein [Sphingobium sp. Cam5-1]|uniref:hypothetical protein n=1 Tax=Sphingobium sp. Cam5-1 TaxID=2789327 RepID=UPI0018AD0F11|nr:hypothetical protein [Sphingobium sp. Cam5-1]QPI72684.1 hypothetical protein IZV00_12620 [Sphingobium sp. Cam5-1]
MLLSTVDVLVRRLTAWSRKVLFGQAGCDAHDIAIPRSQERLFALSLLLAGDLPDGETMLVELVA